MKIRIARMCYPVHTLGPGNRVGIWLPGCSKNCPGCISPDFQSEKAGREMDLQDILSFLFARKDSIDGFTISGGEPFTQKEALAELVSEIRSISEDIILFSGFTYQELIAMKDASVDRVLSLIGLLVDGPYVEEMNDGKGMRGSGNQNFIRLNHPEYYEHLENWKRNLQVMMYQDKLISIGIPGEIR